MAKWSTRLRQERERRGWTQLNVADQVGVGQKTVSRWELGKRKPTPYGQQKLGKLFDLSLEAFGFVDPRPADAEQRGQRGAPQEQEQPFPPVWTVPFQVPLFVGRADILERLRDALLSGQTTALTQAISGLGGIGKTLTAAKYAYHYRSEYEAVIWMEANDRERLTAGVVTMARELDLPEKRLKDPDRVIAAVRQWMKDHARWLLILDNVEDIAALNALLPSARRGHVLLTTRSQATGAFVLNIELADMTPDEGALLLLRKAGMLARTEALEAAFESDRELARYISRLMGGLPLALDQAGAYIEARACRLSEYIELYQQRRVELLRWRSPRRTGERYEYPHSVATTWSLSFEKVEQESPAAAALLGLYSFLHPDAIPEEVAILGSPALGPQLQALADPLAFTQVLAELRRYSLVRLHAGQRAASVHRLVQAVFKDRMDEPAQRSWAERAVRAVHRTLLCSEFDDLQGYERYLPHIHACAGLIEQFAFTFEEAIVLLHVTGFYLRERAWYSRAEPYSKRALELSEQEFGPESDQVILCLLNLADLYLEQGEYNAAEVHYERALATSEHIWGLEHYNTASCLHNLAHLARLQGNYSRAESLYQRALAIRRSLLEPDHLDIAASFNGLAVLYQEMGGYDQAEPLIKHALSIRERQLEHEDIEVATCYNNLATNYLYQRKEFSQVESLSRRAWETYEMVYGKDHPMVAQCMNTLAEAYALQGKYEQAEPLFQRSLAIRKKMLGSAHADIAQSLTNLGALYEELGRYPEAESLYREALLVAERSVGTDHPKVAMVLRNYASLLQKVQREPELQEVKARINTILSKLPEHEPHMMPGE